MTHRIFYLLVLLLMTTPYLMNGQCSPASAQTTLDVNNVAAGLLNGGDLWWDWQNAKYEVPKGSGSHSLFAGGLWIGGIDDGGQLRVAGQTYRQAGNDYWPGPIEDDGTTNSDMCARFDQFYQITQLEIETMQDLGAQYNVGSGGQIPESKIPQNVLDWPAKGNPFFIGADGQSFTIENEMAPYINTDDEPGYDPTKGDYPKMRGDEMFWWVFNDVGNFHGETSGLPLGIEVHASAYAYSTADHLNNTTFYRFKVISKMYDFDILRLGMFVDFDLGNYTDDYVGCDSSRNLGIGYNGDNLDEGSWGYGVDPPFIGIDILNVNAPGQESKGMSHFMYYNNDFSTIGNPEEARHYYDYLRSVWKDGSHLTQGGNGFQTGVNTNYIYPSEPDDVDGWSECQEGNTPFDRRMVLGSGPYRLNKSEAITLDFAAIWARCNDYEMCPSFDCIQMASDQVQARFDNQILPTGIDEEIKAGNLQITPNPAKDRLNVKIDKPGSHRYRLYDASGKLAQQGVIEKGTTTLNISGLKSGIYLFSLEEGRVAKKIMVTR